MTNSVLAALVNGMLLSVPLTLAVWLGLRMAPRGLLNAATRYMVWWATLAVTAALPILYLPAHSFHSNPQAPSISRPAPLRAVAPQVRRPAVSVETAQLADAPAPVRRLRFPFELPAGPWPQRVAAAWMFLSLLMLARLIASCALLSRRKTQALPVPPHLARRLEQWLARSGSTRGHVRLASSPDVTTPMVAGLGRPVILIPAHMLDALAEDELDQIGLHEAAHLARRDDYALILQRSVEALFALHPVVRWIARRIDLEREIACDDFVVEATGRARSYAACLTHVAEMAGGIRSALVAVTLTEDRSHLATRVESLLDKTRHTGTRLLKARLATMTAALVALVCLSARTPGLIAFAAPQTTATPVVAESSRVPAILVAQAPPAPPPQNRPTDPAPPPPATPAIVRIPVQVTDPLKRFVTGLEKETFRLFEDDVEQEITQVSNEDTPLSIGIVIDASAAMDGKLPRAREAVARFLKASNPRNEYFLVQAGDSAELLLGLTTNTGEVEERLATVQAQGKMALLDGIHLAVQLMKNAENPRRAVLAISGGGEDNSGYSKREIMSALELAAVQVTLIQLSTLASEPADAAAKAAIELRNPYVLGYSPKNSALDGNLRKVRVELVQPRGLPPLTVTTLRKEYYAANK